MTRPPNFNKKTDSDQISDSTKIVRLIVEELETHFFKNPDADTYAVCKSSKGTREVYRTDSRDFARWIAWRYYIIHQKALPRQTLSDAIGVLEGRAAFLSPVEKTFRRVAGHSGKVYLDLCDERWRVIEVDAKGWRILDQSPVNFTRSKAMLALPEPRPGSVDYLRNLLNVSDQGWKLIAGWLLGCLNPDGPYPLLVLGGEQGTAKKHRRRVNTKHARPQLRAAAIRTAKRRRTLHCRRKILIAPVWIMCPRVSHPVSDALCRIATGAGQSTRKLYSDSDEHILNLCKPSILNGIGDLFKQ